MSFADNLIVLGDEFRGIALIKETQDDILKAIDI